jgi:hypothetical protein
MRSEFGTFRAAYGRPVAPAAVWQAPLDGDPGHYARLLALHEGLPAAIDALDYAHDIAFQPKVQPDLFACLLPLCLRVWRHDLMGNHQTEHAGFVELFHAALARRPLIADCLTVRQADAVSAFMRHALLDRIDREDSLSYAGEQATAYAWLFRLGSFAVIFPALEDLWRAWWRIETPGQAVAALQYASCLMYDDRANPIFAPRSPKRGGGPPALWETDGQHFDETWKLENVLFLMEAVTAETLRDVVARAARALEGVLESDLPARMLADFETRRPLLEARLRVLPDLLSRPLSATLEWPPG